MPPAAHDASDAQIALLAAARAAREFQQQLPLPHPVREAAADPPVLGPRQRDPVARIEEVIDLEFLTERQARYSGRDAREMVIVVDPRHPEALPKRDRVVIRDALLVSRDPDAPHDRQR